MNLTTTDMVKAAFPDQITGIIGPFTFSPSLDGVANTISVLKQKATGFYTSNHEPSPAVAHWRSIYKKMGASPKYASSLEGLERHFRENGNLWQIHPVVDLYNWISLCFQIPMAAYDTARLSGNIQLRFAQKGEPFIPLGNPKQTEKTKENEVVYADGGKIVCRYWNYRDCHETRITSETKNIVVFADITRQTCSQPDSLLLEISRHLENALAVSSLQTQLV